MKFFLPSIRLLGPFQNEMPANVWLKRQEIHQREMPPRQGITPTRALREELWEEPPGWPRIREEARRCV